MPAGNAQYSHISTEVYIDNCVRVSMQILWMLNFLPAGATCIKPIDVTTTIRNEMRTSEIAWSRFKCLQVIRFNRRYCINQQ